MEPDKVLDTVAKGTGVLAVMALVLSVIYDWGFYYALNLGFIEVPTSIGDHIRSGLIWLPKALFAFFVGFAIEFMNRRIERGLTEEEIIKSSRNPERLRKFRRGPSVLFRILALTTVALFLLVGDVYRGLLPLSIIICWAMFSEWVNNAPLLKVRRSEATRWLFHWLPMVFFFVFFMGYNNASDLVSKDIPQFKLSLNESKGEVGVNILRQIERGTLVINPNSERMTFYPWSDVTKLEPSETYKPYLGLLGRILGKSGKPSFDRVKGAANFPSPHNP
jgi:hypothetical protein